jgi:geranylgeranyl reductase family protein
MKYDVIIVGAGPAGSTTAKFLAEKGVKVLLIDKDKFPRDKPCGGGLPARVLEKYSYINNEKSIEAYSYGGTLFSPSLKNKIEVKKDSPIIGTTLRKKFDYELVNIAKNSGAVFQDEKHVIDVKVFNDKATILLKDGGSIEAEIIVGADGVWSVIAQKTGLREKSCKMRICFFQEFEVDEAIMDEYFTKSRNSYIHSRFQHTTGYGWVFPKKKHLNIGLGNLWSRNFDIDNKNVKKHYYNYISYLKNNKLIPKNLKPVKIKGGALPFYPLKKTYDNRIILVGDAGGFINPISGEGIYYAMTSGKIAAKVINEAFEKKETNAKFLSKFQKCWKKEFGKDLKLMYKALKRPIPKEIDKSFEIVKQDQKLKEIFIGITTGELSISNYKWEIILRHIIASLKTWIKRNINRGQPKVYSKVEKKSI